MNYEKPDLVSDFVRFYQSSRGLESPKPKRSFHDFDVIARTSFIGALHGQEVISGETLQSVFCHDDDTKELSGISWGLRTFIESDINSELRELTSTIADEPGMEHALDLDLTPKAGELAFLVHEGEGDHVCAAAVFRLSVREGIRHTLDDGPWSGQAPGPTVEVTVQFHTATIRRYLDPADAQRLQLTIAAHLAQCMSDAVRRMDELLVKIGQHAWIRVGVDVAGDLRVGGPVSASLIRTIRKGFENGVEWINSEAFRYSGLDKVEIID